MPVDALSDTASVHATSRPVDAALRDRQHQQRFARLGDLLEARAMFVIAVSAVLVLSLLVIPLHLSQDGWLALVAGRSIAAHGLPQHDYFAHMTYGARWTDQQWLAQLLMYEVQQIGGLQLMTVMYVFVTGLAFGAAVAAARALQAEDLHVLMAALPGAFFYLATAVSIRTQGLGYPLFVATLWLLASEVRSTQRRRRVYLVFPMLVVWANLHGSATLGAGLVGLYGLLLLAGDVRARGLSGVANGRAWAFMLLSPLALLATPYGLGMVHYYSTTILNSQFGRMVSEWKPAMSIPVLAIPLFVLIAMTIWVVARAQHRARSDRSRRPAGVTLAPPLFDVLTLIVLAIGAVMAVRNITWFGLAVMVLLPPAITQANGGKAAPLRRARVNRRLAEATLVLTAVVTVVVLTRPTNWFTSTYPTKSVPTLRALVAGHPRARILADVRFADWMIWEDPSMFSGRVAYDTSFELLTKPQLTVIADLAANTTLARSTVDSYRIWMLDPGNRKLNRLLLRHPHVRVVSRTGKVLIALHQPPRSP